MPLPGGGLEERLPAVRGSPDQMGMDGLGGDTILQSKTAIVSPSERPSADVDHTFVRIFPDQSATVTYKMSCGSISADDLTAASIFLKEDDITIQKKWAEAQYGVPGVSAGERRGRKPR